VLTTFAVILGATISDVLSDLGYLGFALLMVAETVFPPIPSEVVLPLAGYLVEQGDFTFVGALVASTAGSLVGALALEEAARHGGRPFAERFVRFAHQDPAKLDDAERWFRRRGWLMVLAGRCIPGVRSLVALPAGVLRMPRGEYVVLTLIGSTIWNALLIGAVYAQADQAKAEARAAESKTKIATDCANAYLTAVGSLLQSQNPGDQASTVEKDLQSISDTCKTALAGT